MILSLYSFNILLQTIATILSLLFLIKDKSSFLKLLSILLLITVSIEFIGLYLMKNEKPSIYYYHFLSLIEFPIIFLMYERFIAVKKVLIFPKIILIITFLFWVLTFFKFMFYELTIILGSLSVSILIILYLRELLMSDKILNYRKLLPFWVAVGFLLFYLSSIPFFSLQDYMKDRGLFSVLFVLIIIKCLFIIFGLITCNKRES